MRRCVSSRDAQLCTIHSSGNARAVNRSQNAPAASGTLGNPSVGACHSHAGSRPTGANPPCSPCLVSWHTGIRKLIGRGGRPKARRASPQSPRRRDVSRYKLQSRVTKYTRWTAYPAETELYWDELWVRPSDAPFVAPDRGVSRRRVLRTATADLRCPFWKTETTALTPVSCLTRFESSACSGTESSQGAHNGGCNNKSIAVRGGRNAVSVSRVPHRELRRGANTAHRALYGEHRGLRSPSCIEALSFRLARMRDALERALRY